MKIIKILGLTIVTLAILFTNTACGENSEPENTQNQSAIEEQYIIPLQFKDVVIENNITHINEDKIQEIIKQHNVGDNKFIIFIHKEDKEDFHSGVIINKKIYDFGKVSMLIEKNNSDLYSIEEVKLFGINSVKIQGAMGSNYALTNYYFIDNDLPQTLLRAEGHTEELDLDKDGMQEVVSSVVAGATSFINIYEYDNGKLTVSNLNEALDAITVIIKDGKVFEAYFEYLPNQLKQYEYLHKKLIEIK
ncbi:hypothetical protein [Proteiniborus sp. MB09-C3]|uniref:hypothetical protein n=1 Tax=Proteiniborus sp. MB09-C3 TaxID=3050072 RepID=UPI00255218E2|nr:hypothetical protein [Proteiniborus sp. MB09-C3]WIV12921.1 hypothetical protein QO263_04210 [Proteiniborus sp. MB09-C3]